MNGLDFVREEMERRGYSKSQIESKTAAVVVDILTEGRANYLEMVDNESAETRRLESLHHQIREAERTGNRRNLKLSRTLSAENILPNNLHGDFALLILCG